MLISLNRIRQRITSVAHELRENVACAGELGDGGAVRLVAELAMFTAGFKACQDAVIFEKAYIVDPQAEIEVPKQWEKYFEKEQEEYQEYLRLKEKFENGK